MSRQPPKIVIPSAEQFDGRALASSASVLLGDFFYAASRCDNETVFECLRLGVSINAFDMIGRTVFHIAAATGNVELVDALIHWPGRNLNAQTADFQLTALHEAVLVERIEIVECFLVAGAKVNIPNGNGETAVHMAVKLDAFAILRLLIAYKANLNVVDAFANTPLSRATIDTKSYNVCVLLLRHGARVNKVRPKATYILHEAVLSCLRTEDVAFLQLLIKYGAYANHVDASGRNALHYAAIAGLPDVVGYLLDCGVRVNVRDRTHRTPLEVAVQHGHTEAARLITQRMQAPPSPLASLPPPSYIFTTRDAWL